MPSLEETKPKRIEKMRFLKYSDRCGQCLLIKHHLQKQKIKLYTQLFIKVLFRRFRPLLLQIRKNVKLNIKTKHAVIWTQSKQPGLFVTVSSSDQCMSPSCTHCTYFPSNRYHGRHHTSQLVCLLYLFRIFVD